MTLEVAILNIRSGSASNFEVAFKEASRIISSMPGYISHELLKCVETDNRYILLVRWKKLEDHSLAKAQHRVANSFDLF